jgi:uncharacterized membrane protein YedE/YeeE
VAPPSPPVIGGFALGIFIAIVVGSVVGGVLLGVALYFGITAAIAAGKKSDDTASLKAAPAKAPETVAYDPYLTDGKWPINKAMEKGYTPPQEDYIPPTSY